MPFPDKRLVVLSILAIMPGRGGREAFLSQGIYGEDPVAARILARGFIGIARLGNRLGRQACHLLSRAIDARTLHTVDAIAAEVGLRPGRPFQVALPALF